MDYVVDSVRIISAACFGQRECEQQRALRRKYPFRQARAHLRDDRFYRTPRTFNPDFRGPLAYPRANRDLLSHALNQSYTLVRSIASP
ncbi:hypothetical protein [Burkholderia sp. WP9]|uniref:hypothetical protein n=1 Tax=Burkholderia sp. WP9 TaxID=1500263 RepID=UPI000B8A4D15|nr:hypothetical protein [Burkholderia sp. WP9]